MMRALLIALVCACLASAAFADEVVAVVGPPHDCHLKVEYEAREELLHLRPQNPAKSQCGVTPQMLQAALYIALDKQEVRQDRAILRSIFLGRLIDYPSLSRSLIEASYRNGKWDTIKGHAVGTSDNELVSALLVNSFAFLSPTLADHGYAIAGISVEKVISQDFGSRLDDVSGQWKGPDLRPVDALVHLQLTRKP